MRYPWVNTLLLLFVPAALVSGYFGLTNGDPDRGWILWVHAAVAYAIVAVLAWKWAVVRRSLDRHPVLDSARAAFVVMGCLLVFVLASGILWATGGRVVLGQYSLLTLHEIAAIGVGVLFGWHVVARRVLFRVPRSRDRRAFLRLAIAGTAGVAAWQAAGALSRVLGLPGANRRFTGSYETGSFTGSFPSVSWLNDDPRPVDLDAWRLTVDGHVDQPLALSLDDALRVAQIVRTAIIHCTGGWYSEQQWSGLPLAGLLAMARARPGAGSITVTSVTGFNRRFSLDEAQTALIALQVAGQPLTHDHGAPARLVVPDHRGFDWVKWVTRITVNHGGDLWQSPLPYQ